MNETWKTRFVTFRPVILLSLFLIAALLGGVDLLNHATAPLTKKNAAYLDRAIRDTTHLLIPVGIAKAAADMIEGSTIQFEAGIVVTKGGMTVEAGDVMQPMLECINLAWKILLGSTVFLIAVKSFINGCPELAQPFCVLFLFCYLLDALFAFRLKKNHLQRHILQRMGGIFVLCWLIIVAVLPLTLAGTAFLTERTTAHMRADIEKTFERVNTVFNMEGFTQTTELSEKANYLKQKLTEVSRFAREELSTVTLAICQLLAIKMLSGVLYPLLMLAFLIWLIRGCLYPALASDTKKEEPLSDDQPSSSQLQQVATRGSNRGQ